MPEWKVIAGMLCIQTFQCASVLLSRLGPPLCGHCFVLADRGFLLDAVLCLPLVLWLWHWRAVVCKRQYITAPGFTQLPASHSWEVSEFPGRQTWAAFALARATSEGLESCFVMQARESGCGTRESPARAITTTCQKWVPFAPPLSHFCAEWLLWCF